MSFIFIFVFEYVAIRLSVGGSIYTKDSHPVTTERHNIVNKSGHWHWNIVDISMSLTTFV